MDRSERPVRSFGRRLGRTLRPGRQRVLSELMPELSIGVPPGDQTIDPRGLFSRDVDDVWLEIGFGAGEHLLGQLRAHPDVGFIGCEPYLNGVAALFASLPPAHAPSVRIFTDDARLLLPALPDGALGRVYLLFPDPWPKRRHHRRRFISPRTIDALARVMREGAELRFASDHPEYVRWTLWQMTRRPEFCWLARRADDWRTPPRDWIDTRYAAKAAAQGAVCTHLQFSRTAWRPGRPSA